MTYEDADRHSGETVTIEGTFGHIDRTHGIVKIDGGLWIYIPHFDLFKRGDDWEKYDGKRCSATGVLHTYTKDIPGYRGPSLQITSFSASE